MIYIASDHAGFHHKEHLVAYLASRYEVCDCGAYEYNQDDDYPTIIAECMNRMKNDTTAYGIIFGGSGQGEAMVANRHAGIRATVYYGGDDEIIRLSRQHNNANVLSLGARFITLNQMVRVVDMWLETPFTHEDRHTRRIACF